MPANSDKGHKQHSNHLDTCRRWTPGAGSEGRGSHSHHPDTSPWISTISTTSHSSKPRPGQHKRWNKPPNPDRASKPQQHSATRKPAQARRSNKAAATTQQAGMFPRTTVNPQHRGTQRRLNNECHKTSQQLPSITTSKPTRLRGSTPYAARSSTKGGSTRHTKQQLAHPAKQAHPALQPSNGDAIPPGPGIKEPGIKQIKRGSMRNSPRGDGASRHTLHGDKSNIGCTARSSENKGSASGLSRAPPEPTNRGYSPSF